MLPTLGVDLSKDNFHIELSVNNKLRHRRFANREQGLSNSTRGWRNTKPHVFMLALKRPGLTVKLWHFIFINRAIG